MSPRKKADSLPPPRGTFVLVGGGEFRPGCRDLDAELVAASAATEVLVLPTAAAYEHPERVGDRAAAHFEDLGATVRTLDVLHRGEAEDPKNSEIVREAKFVYLADGSPLHLRSVLKDSALFEALLAVVPRWWGARGVGRGCHRALRPDGGSARWCVHRRARGRAQPRRVPVPRHRGRTSAGTLDRPASLRAPRWSASTKRPRSVRDAGGSWRVAGTGHVTVYDGGSSDVHDPGVTIAGLPT